MFHSLCLSQSTSIVTDIGSIYVDSVVADLIDSIFAEARASHMQEAGC